MAVDAYIATAASQLRDAVTHLQGEIRAIQTDAYDHEQRLKSEASHAEYDKVRVNAELQEHKTYDEKPNTQPYEARLQELEQRIHHDRDEASRTSQESASAVQKKSNLLSRLQQLATQLESLSATARSV